MTDITDINPNTITTAELERITGKSTTEQVADPPCLMYFSAAWCAPCKALSPRIEAFAAKHPELDVKKIDVDTQRELAQLYNIKGIPTLVLMIDSDEKFRVSGASPEIEEKIEALLPSK